jgi:hypothetical protein
VIHPTSSGLQGWARVLGRSPSLGASPSFVVVIPPPLAVVLAAVLPLSPFPPRHYSPPSPLFPPPRCCSPFTVVPVPVVVAVVVGGGGRCWSSGLPPVFLPAVVLRILVVRRWRWSAGRWVLCHCPFPVCPCRRRLVVTLRAGARSSGIGRDSGARCYKIIII